MNRNEYARAVALGWFIGVSSFALVYMVSIALDVKEPPQKEVKPPNFEVVDEYKGCDVVRWTQSNLAEYKYFLHCNNTRPVYEK